MARKTTVYKLERHKWPDEIAAEKRRTKLAVIILVVAISCFSLGVVGTYSLLPRVEATTATTTNVAKSKFETIYNILTSKWYFANSFENLNDELYEDAINGMMQYDVDKHTQYMDSEVASSFSTQLAGSFSGIGVSFTDLENVFIIRRVYQGSPADQAGILQGDEIVAVDGVSVEGKTSEDLKVMVRGDANTNVVIRVKRKDEFLDLTCIRNNIDTTTYLTYYDDVAVLEVNSFSEDTAKYVEERLKDIKEANITNIVFDLRNDGGGYLSTYLAMANLVAPYNTVAIQEKSADGSILKRVTSNENPYTFDNIIVLVNENTASAAEVFTALLKEGLGAKVVGKNTYGKGTVQTSYGFSDGSIIKYTIAEWLTTNGNSINGSGIAPDVEVDNIAVYSYNVSMEEGATVEEDSVSSYTVIAQNILDLLGYEPGRNDGYFSVQTKEALMKFQSANGLEADGILDSEVFEKLKVENARYYYSNEYSLDLQLQSAIEEARK